MPTAGRRFTRDPSLRYSPTNELRPKAETINDNASDNVTGGAANIHYTASRLFIHYSEFESPSLNANFKNSKLLVLTVVRKYRE